MTEARLAELLERFQHLKIVVVGDLFLDQWFDIDPALDEPSVETGLTAWQVTSMSASPGAAGTVINNLYAMGIGQLDIVSFVGADGNGWHLRYLLEKQNVCTQTLFTVPERMTPAYLKPMFNRNEKREEGHRLDIKNREPTPSWVEDQIMDSLDTLAANADAMMILDQLTEVDTGVVTARVRNHLATLGERYPNLILYADSRERISQFRNVMIKCNHLEAAKAIGKELPILHALKQLREITHRPVFITLGKDGIATSEGIVPAAKQTGPIDVCGAGDSTSAALVSALCCGASPKEAALLGNLSAGVTVRKLGTTGTASQAEMMALYHEQFKEQL